MSVFRILCCLVLIRASLAIAADPTPQTLINLCNQNAGFAISAAIAKQEAGQWQSQGWYQVPASQCVTVNEGDYTGPLYFYGEYNGGQISYGSGPFQFCVQKTGTFTLAEADESSQCTGADEKMIKGNLVNVQPGITTTGFSAITQATTLNLCNQATAPLQAAYAIAGTPAGTWQSIGWTQVPSHQCQTITLGSYLGKAYLYAEINGGLEFWGSGPVSICVAKAATFSINNSTDATTCLAGAGNKMVPVSELTLGPGTATFTFNP